MFQISEIIWARIRGFPWWPGRVVSPTPPQLKQLSVDRIPPDHRLVWFFNDNDKYTLINVKNIRSFCDDQVTSITKNRTGKHAAQLKKAFEQASAEYRRPVNLDDVDAIDAIAIAPSSALQSRPTPSQSKKSKKRKTSHVNSSPHSEERPLDHIKNGKTSKAKLLPNAMNRRLKPVRETTSQRKTNPTSRPSADAESDRLSTHCNPSPCDRSSQETGIDSHANKDTRKDNPRRSIPLLLRIREKRKDSAEPESSSSKRRAMKQSVHTSSSEERLRKKQQEQHGSLGTRERPNGSTRDKKRKTSDLPPKRRRGALYDKGAAAKRRRVTVTEETAEDTVGLSKVRLRDAMESIGISSDEDEAEVGHGKRRMFEAKPNCEVTRIMECDGIGQSDGQIRRSKRTRRVSSKMARTDEGNNSESEDDNRQPVGSKRSRGIEAPRMSDGQRRLHIQEGKVKGRADVGVDSKAKLEFLDVADEESEGVIDEAAKPFQELSKDECITVILKMQEALRRKSVQLWLRGRKLVEAKEVVRTEEDLIKACECGVAMAEKLLRWAKKHKGYDKGEGSRFARMELRTVEECEVLVDVYFDRRRVSLKKIGPRILELSKEMRPYSRKVMIVLQELIVLWLDLTTAKKVVGQPTARAIK